MRNHLSGLLMAALFAGAAQAAALPPVDALLHYEGQEITRAGLIKRIAYDEYFIRREGHVWSQRVLPKAVSQLPPEPHGRGIHEEFDIDGTSRHVSLDPHGTVKVEFVTRARDLIVAVSPTDYEVVAFVTSFDAAGALIEPAAVAKMKKMHRASAVTGAVWREATQGDRYTRVLWSSQMQLALVLETGNQSGSITARTTLKLLPKTADDKLPWLGLAQLPQKDYADFMD